MRRTFVQIAIVTTALAAVAPALASTQPTDAPVAASATTANATQFAGLCGITHDDVLDIVAHYDLEPDPAGVQAMLAVPFDCNAYGGLCNVLDQQEAKAYACQVWGQLEAHAEPTAIELAAAATLAQGGTTCEPDLERCEDICDPHAVLGCDGILVGTACKQLAICDIPRLRWVIGFDPLIVATL
ncbi:MAG TPA: hypothetical protein VFG69_09735 [Nannocystaceae bacterium]|nr:hypothetical protein [Nannocystaceae bacterium]